MTHAFAFPSTETSFLSRFIPTHLHATIMLLETPRPLRTREPRSGFTLVEMMVSIVILVILMTIIFQIMQLTSSAYKQTTQGTGTMQQARVAFERMTRNLSQATLNTYYNYYYASGQTTPSRYIRQSELQFISGYGPIAGGDFITAVAQNAKQVTHAVFFQAPLGVVSSTDATAYGNLGGLLNACGYFVTYGPDPSRPTFLSSSGFANAPPSENRYRLMEYLQPSENLSIYTSAAPGNTGTLPGWISYGLPTNMAASAPANVRALASNIVALIIMPEQYSSSTVGTNGQAHTQYISSAVKDGITSVSSYAYDSAYYSGATPLYSDIAAGTTLEWRTHNQLPPLIKVIMVAIDEASGARLAATPTYSGCTSASPPDMGNLSTSTAALFKDPSKLHSAGATTGDLEKLEDVLNATPGNVTGNTVKCNFYVFQTDVIIRGAKWTAN